MYFAGPVDLGPMVYVLFFVVIAIVAFIFISSGSFIYVVAKKIKNNDSQVQHKNSLLLAFIVLLGSIFFLYFYFHHITDGPLMAIVWAPIATILISQMNKPWAIFAAVITVLTIGAFVFNQYPQYTGRHCKDYPSFLECRTPRYSR